MATPHKNRSVPVQLPEYPTRPVDWSLLYLSDGGPGLALVNSAVAGTPYLDPEVFRDPDSFRSRLQSERPVFAIIEVHPDQLSHHVHFLRALEVDIRRPSPNQIGLAIVGPPAMSHHEWTIRTAGFVASCIWNGDVGSMRDAIRRFVDSLPVEPISLRQCAFDQLPWGHKLPGDSVK